MSLALIKEVCPNTNYIRHINRGNYAYANFSLDLKMIKPSSLRAHSSISEILKTNYTTLCLQHLLPLFRALTYLSLPPQDTYVLTSLSLTLSPVYQPSSDLSSFQFSMDLTFQSLDSTHKAVIASHPSNTLTFKLPSLSQST